MKAILISIRPEWCEKIASGEKTVEIRKTRPKLQPPFRCYIYCTIGDGAAGDILPKSRVTCGKVIGEFVCENIDFWHISHLVLEQNAKIALKGTCLTSEEVKKYIGYEWGKNIWERPYEFFGWNISDLVIYDTPRPLADFSITRPPQSWCYVEEVTT